MRLIDADAMREDWLQNGENEFIYDTNAVLESIDEQPTVDAVEVPCRCCDCYYLLNSKNSFGVYFFCGHQNGLKNLRNTEKDFCPYAKRRADDRNA